MSAAAGVSADARAELRLMTPEGVVFALPLAGPVTRALAWGIDMAAILAATSIIDWVARAFSPALPGVSSMFAILAVFLLLTLYGALLEWLWQGQTLGKRLLGLRVMDAHGLPLLGSQLLMRNLLRAVDELPAAYMVGGLACMFGERAQRIGDRIAGTVVVRARRPPPPDLSVWSGGKYNSLARYTHLALRMRERASPQDARLALAALVHRDQLLPAARLELYRGLEDFFQSLVAFPPEAVDALSAEHYLRGIVAILFPKADGDR